MSREKWEDIIGFEGCYQASDLGRVRSMPRRVMTDRREIGVNPPVRIRYVNHRGRESVRTVFPKRL